MDEVILSTNLPFPKKSGKVRDIYDLDDKLLIVTTDRISAFDKVFPNGVPNKGKVLNKMSSYWFSQLNPSITTHYITDSIKEMVSEIDSDTAKVLLEEEKWLKDRSMLVNKHEPLPIEFIVRSFLTGSSWKEYKEKGTVASVKMPKGMKENQPFPFPIFTPSTKAETGHDVNISIDEMLKILLDKGFDEDFCLDVVEQSLEVFEDIALMAFNKGIIVADTKMEWGHISKQIPVLIDEVVTPDSSRFWGVENYRLDGPIPSFDKQYVRDYLTQSDWDKESDPPVLPDEVVNNTSKKYMEAYKDITGKEL